MRRTVSDKTADEYFKQDTYSTFSSAPPVLLNVSSSNAAPKMSTEYGDIPVSAPVAPVASSEYGDIPLGAPPPAPLPTNDPTFDLNNRFQSVAEKLFSLTANADAETMWKLNVEFVKVSRDFLHVAQTVSKVIISEVYVEESKRTIKPEKLSGIIGGVKYLVHSVLFKFAIYHQRNDAEQLTVIEASKIAGHELKSLAHLWECKSGVCLPLQCIIDYLGFRMVAMLYLPIKNEVTLKVGSSDGGKTYLCANESLMNKMTKIGKTYLCANESLMNKMTKIGKKLNLAGHKFLGQEIFVPFDLEGHLGKDGKEYLLDFSRLFPPVPLTPGCKFGNLYRLFRPEFVRNYPKPMCSDGYAPLMREQTHHHDVLQEAFKSLMEEAIPFASTILDDLSAAVIKKGMVLPGNFVWHPSRTLHELGINLRYMGNVYSHCKTPEARTLLLIEMAARSIKQDLRQKIRAKMEKEKFPLENEYIILLVSELNSRIFLPDTKVWDEIGREMKKYFDFPEGSFPSRVNEEIFNFVFHLDPRYENDFPDSKFGNLLLFDRIRQMMAFKVNKAFLQRIYSGIAKQLKVVVVTGVGQKIKHMNIISHAEGWLLRNDDPHLALKRFDTARESSPLNKFTLRNVATMTVELERKKQREFDDDFIKYVEYLFKLAIVDDQYSDTHSLYQYGKFLLIAGKYDKAEEYLVQSIEAYPEHKEAWHSLMECLNAQKKPYSRFLDFYESIKK
uniref:Clu domain-containing protein n=1 Tax=Arcella intermedia TaxID=1963864 RepID=A0A6B2KY78_9EUKA